MALRSVSANAGNYLKFSGRTGSWSWGADEITDLVFLADLKNLAEGWLLYQKGKRPDRLFDPDGGWPPCPSSEHKQGMLLRVKLLEPITGGGEFSTTALGALRAFDRVHDQYIAERRRHRGKVPIIAVTGRESFGLAMAPVLRLQGWQERPVDLPDGPPHKPTEAWDRDAAVDAADALDPEDELY
jgi:hypothetical protein